MQFLRLPLSFGVGKKLVLSIMSMMVGLGLVESGLAALKLYIFRFVELIFFQV